MSDKKYENTTPVFRLKPDNRSNSATIRHVGFLNNGEKLGDETIELDRPIHPHANVAGKHAIPIKNVDEYEMTGRLFRCNIVGSHIIMSNRYPLLYLNVHYDRPMVSGSLFQIFFSIEINNDEKRQIKENKDFVNLHFNGIWYRHIDCDEEFIENFDKLLIELLENEALELIFKSDNLELIKSRENMSEDEIALWVDNYVLSERKFYDNLIKNQEMEFKSFSRLRDSFVSLCTSEKFHNFIKIAMKCRELHRRKEYGLDDDSTYVLPEKITKLNDITNKLIEDNELVLDNYE